MEQQQPTESTTVIVHDSNDGAALDYIRLINDDGIKLQSYDSIALNELLSDLEFKAESYQSVADMHFKNWANDTPPFYYTMSDCLVAYGIYVNKAQDMRDLVNKWKPNKK